MKSPATIVFLLSLCLLSTTSIRAQNVNEEELLEEGIEGSGDKSPSEAPNEDLPTDDEDIITNTEGSGKEPGPINPPVIIPEVADSSTREITTTATMEPTTTTSTLEPTEKLIVQKTTTTSSAPVEEPKEDIIDHDVPEEEDKNELFTEEAPTEKSETPKEKDDTPEEPKPGEKEDLEKSGGELSLAVIIGIVVAAVLLILIIIIIIVVCRRKKASRRKDPSSDVYPRQV